MIHTARQSPKFLRLVRRIRPLVGPDSIIDADSVAVSILERLWHATIAGAKRGDIGKFENDVIAEMVGWMGDPDELVEILTETGWIDECDQFRLVVHDWSHHAPNHVKGVVKKIGGFVEASTQGSGPGEAPRVADQVADPGSATQGQGPPNQTKPNLTQRNQTKPNQIEEAPQKGATPIQEKKKRKPTAAQKPPTVAEVSAYCRERGNVVDPEQFVDHYTANGWKQSNGNPIRDWQAAVRTWERNDYGQKRRQDIAVQESNKPKRKPLTAEAARYQLVKVFGVKEARDWSEERCKREYLATIARSSP